MKKVLLSIGVMIILLQFSNTVQAYPGKYMIQDKPVTFFEMKSTEFNSSSEEIKETEDIKSTQDITVGKKETSSQTEEKHFKNIQQKHSVSDEKQFSDEKSLEDAKQPENNVQDVKSKDNHVEQEEKTLIDDNYQSDFDKTQEQDIVGDEYTSNENSQHDNSFVVLKDVQMPELKIESGEPASPETVEKFREAFDKNLDNAVLITDNADIIALKGLFMMYKAIFYSTEQTMKYEEMISALDTKDNDETKIAEIMDIKRNMLDELAGKLETLDFASISQDRKYMWGQGSYVLQIAQNRIENAANDMSPYYNLIAIGTINPKDVRSELEKASALILRIKDTMNFQGAAIGLACRINDENQIKIKIPENELVHFSDDDFIAPFRNILWNDIHAAGQKYLNNVILYLGNLVVNSENDLEKNEYNRYYVINATLKSIEKSLENDPNFKLNADQNEMIKTLQIDTLTLKNMYSEYLKKVKGIKKKISNDKLLKNTMSIEFESFQNLLNDAAVQEQSLKNILDLSKKIQQKLK